MPAQLFKLCRLCLDTRKGCRSRAFCRAMTFTFHAFVCAGLGCILASIYILR
ncbi:MAG: hypothetical protein K2P26_02755 [Oscillospiraceae bacterium]|nr:hypothetical protein [Oscillospiraceae bacterium]